MTETPSQLNARRHADRHKTMVGQQRIADANLAALTRQQVAEYLRAYPNRSAVAHFLDLVEAVRNEAAAIRGQD